MLLNDDNNYAGGIQMPLLEDIVEEIDSWKISITNANGEPVSYTNLVKPIYYGIGIDVTKKIISKLAKLNLDEYYFEGSLKTELARFRRDFLADYYAKNNYDAEKTAKELKITNPLRVGAIFRECGTNIKEVRKAYKQRIFRFWLSDQVLLDQKNDGNHAEILRYATEEIKKYDTIVNVGLIRGDRMNQYRDQMATKFVNIALNYTTNAAIERYLGLSYKEAYTLFKKEYLLKQFFRHDQNAIEAAKHADLTPNDYRQALYSFGISINKLKNEIRQ
jgi:hypothetical protein